MLPSRIVLKVRVLSFEIGIQDQWAKSAHQSLEVQKLQSSFAKIIDAVRKPRDTDVIAQGLKNIIVSSCYTCPISNTVFDVYLVIPCHQSAL